MYHKVQALLANENFQATDWGWKLVNSQLYPKTTDIAPAPESLLKIIKWGCRQLCDSNQYSCKKNGLFCIDLCKNCDVGNCLNVDISDVVV